MTPAPFRTRNDGVFDRLEPFLVCAPWHRHRFDLRPFGVPVPECNLIAPTRVDAARFLDRLEVLDRLTFGPKGMPMSRWIFYEAAGIPGGIFGFACRAGSLPPPLTERLQVTADATDLVPLSMYIAIPAHPPHTWFGHNLASLNRVVPELRLRGLGSITKAMALRVFRCRTQLGATQWDSAALHIHTRFGPLELLTAWTPAHAKPATLTYRVRLTETLLRHALGDPDASVAHPPAEIEIPTHDATAMQTLQSRLEAGARLVVAGPPRVGPDGVITVPVSNVPRSGEAWP